MVALLGKFIPQDWGDSNLHIYINIYIYVCPYIYPGYTVVVEHTHPPAIVYLVSHHPTYLRILCSNMCDYVWVSVCVCVCVYIWIHIYIYIYMKRERDAQTSWSQVLIDSSYLAKLCWFPSEKMINRTEKKTHSLSLSFLLCRNGLQIPVAILPKLVLPK